MFNGSIHYKWPFSIAMLVYQRVTGIFVQRTQGFDQNARRLVGMLDPDMKPLQAWFGAVLDVNLMTSWDSTVIFWLSKKETPMSSNPNISHEFPWNTFWDTPWNCIGFFFLDYVLYSTVWTFIHMRKSTGIPLWNGILQWINHGRRWSRRNAHDHHRLRDLCSSWSSCLLSDEVVFACIFVGFASSKIV